MSWFSRLKNAIHPEALERELADEIKFTWSVEPPRLPKRGSSRDKAAARLRCVSAT